VKSRELKRTGLIKKLVKKTSSLGKSIHSSSSATHLILPRALKTPIPQSSISTALFFSIRLGLHKIGGPSHLHLTLPFSLNPPGLGIRIAKYVSKSKSLNREKIDHLTTSHFHYYNTPRNSFVKRVSSLSLSLAWNYHVKQSLIQEAELVASGFRFFDQASTRLGGATHVDAELRDYLVIDEHRMHM